MAQEMNLQRGLVGHWTMSNEDTTGTTLYDQSAYDTHGSLNNGVTSGVSGPGSFDAYSFDGVDDHVRIPEPPERSGDTVFSISGWINPDGGTGWFVNPNGSGADNRIDYNGTDNNINIGYVESANTNGRSQSTSVGSVPINEWTHFVIIMNETNDRVAGYINGSNEFDVTDTAGMASWNQHWHFGNRSVGSLYFPGDLSQIRLYNRSITEEEINELYQMRTQRHHYI